MNVVTLKVSPQEKKKSLKTGIFIGFFIFLCYHVYSYVNFTYFHEKTAQSSPLSLADINYIPFTSGYDLPTASFTFYTKNDKGALQAAEKSLKDLVGKPMIIHMWATWCPPCVEEMPLYNKFAGSVNGNIQNLAIMSGQVVLDDVEAFYKQKNLDNLSIITDEKSVILSGYKLSSLPTTIFVNAKGKPLGFIVGPVSWDDKDVVELVQRILEGE
ncbi:MAG: hypothetical protein COY39_05560 [Alphaproteobacteria bacterium CG_4_10_14_0_8_um_filter_37_21]|nr:MAG: hypothetical protein COY39_05560 [Alphaproteobacteria bacterium CG_4_10_14_0_8_um_filter_37_21]